MIVAIALVVAAGIAVKIAEKTAYDAFVKRAAALKVTGGSHGDAVITEEDLLNLPEPLARHMRFSGAVGRRRISSVHILHSGRFKLGAGKPWMPIHGEYFITTKRPSFTWYGKVRIAGMNVVAFDSYAEGRGRMDVKALSLFPIVADGSEQVSQSAFGRCVAELTMASTFFLDRSHVRCWQAGVDQVRCTVTDGRFSTDADLLIQHDGSLDRVVVMRYFDRGSGMATLERFTGKSSHPKTFAGRVMASRFDGIWNLAEGDLHYVSFDVEGVEFE